MRRVQRCFYGHSSKNQWGIQAELLSEKLARKAVGAMFTIASTAQPTTTRLLE